MFADIGGKWLFLNEYCEVTDILYSGLGEVGFPFMEYPTAKFKFKINQMVEIFLPASKKFRCYTRAWEEDYIGRHFGELHSPYATCDEVKTFLHDRFSGGDAFEQGGKDDPLGITDVTIRYSNELGGVMAIPPQHSRGVNSNGELSSSNIYRAVFRIIGVD